MDYLPHPLFVPAVILYILFQLKKGATTKPEDMKHSVLPSMVVLGAHLAKLVEPIKDWAVLANVDCKAHGASERAKRGVNGAHIFASALQGHLWCPG